MFVGALVNWYQSVMNNDVDFRPFILFARIVKKVGKVSVHVALVLQAKKEKGSNDLHHTYHTFMTSSHNVSYFYVILLLIISNHIQKVS